jgi:tRNA pseudouridine55 synthase
MRNGLLLIDKPAGVTSASVVARVKRILKAEKVGHAGTLDPDATGLLVCLVNAATRVAHYALEGQKCYSGTFRLGVTTSTDDTTGEVLSESNAVPGFAQIESAALKFMGDISQVPPKVSAKKVQGRRAHELERKGVSFELAPKLVRVDSFELWAVDSVRVGYRVRCSPGTYVRALARDLGEALGCGGAAELIRREASGQFDVAHAISLEEISWEAVKDWMLLVPEIPRVVVPPTVASELLQGKPSGLVKVGQLPELAKVVSRPAVFMYTPSEAEEPWGFLEVTSSGQVLHRLNVRPQRFL